MTLPKNGDIVQNAICPNCDMAYEEEQKIGSWQNCLDEYGGCGFIFKMVVKTGKLETE